MEVPIQQLPYIESLDTPASCVLNTNKKDRMEQLHRCLERLKSTFVEGSGAALAPKFGG
jgi:hypothetical protein